MVGRDGGRGEVVRGGGLVGVEVGAGVGARGIYRERFTNTAIDAPLSKL